MPFTPSFTVSQDIADPSILTITDTSTGAADGIVTRRIYLQMADGEYLVPDGTETDYIVWLYSGGSTEEIDVLDVDYALSIRLDFLNGSGTVLYTTTDEFCFSLYSEQFDYSLDEQEAGNPDLVKKTDYIRNRMKLRVNIESANKAVQYGADIYKSQRALDAAKDMIDNENIYFG